MHIDALKSSIKENFVKFSIKKCKILFAPQYHLGQTEDVANLNVLRMQALTHSN